MATYPKWKQKFKSFVGHSNKNFNSGMQLDHKK